MTPSFLTAVVPSSELGAWPLLEVRYAVPVPRGPRRYQAHSIPQRARSWPW